MKKFLFFSMLFCMMSSFISAQDDMYFVPKKNSKDVKQLPPVEYSGSVRDVDEYNRYGGLKSRYYNIEGDSIAGDVISFEPGTYSDSSFVAGRAGSYDTEDDYAYSRRMSRFDDFYWYDPWYYGWYDPYWYGSPYRHLHYGWYDPWYDPWYYGWYRPWAYYGWYYPGYWHGSYYRPYRGVTGTSNHGRVNYGQAGNTNRNFRGYRGTNNRINENNRYNNTDRNNYNDNFRGNRNNGFSRPDVQTRPSYNSGGNFGGSRGGGFNGGGSFGGSRGGSFGGRR